MGVSLLQCHTHVTAADLPEGDPEPSCAEIEAATTSLDATKALPSTPWNPPRPAALPHQHLARSFPWQGPFVCRAGPTGGFLQHCGDARLAPGGGASIAKRGACAPPARAPGPPPSFARRAVRSWSHPPSLRWGCSRLRLRVIARGPRKNAPISRAQESPPAEVPCGAACGRACAGKTGGASPGQVSSSSPHRAGAAFLAARLGTLRLFRIAQARRATTGRSRPGPVLGQPRARRSAKPA